MADSVLTAAGKLRGQGLLLCSTDFQAMVSFSDPCAAVHATPEVPQTPLSDLDTHDLG